MNKWIGFVAGFKIIILFDFPHTNQHEYWKDTEHTLLGSDPRYAPNSGQDAQLLLILSINIYRKETVNTFSGILQMF